MAQFSPEKFKRIRGERGIKYADLAVFAGVHVWTAEAWGRGRHTPTLLNLHAAARALGVEVEELLEEQPVTTAEAAVTGVDERNVPRRSSSGQKKRLQRG